MQLARRSGALRTTRVFRVRVLEVLQGPFGNGVGDRAGEMQGGEGMETLDVATFPDAGYPVTVETLVLLVDFIYGVVTDRFLGFPYAAGGFDAGNGRVEVRAGDPESRGHFAGFFVLYNAG